MFARYVYKAGATVANVLADVCALIAGAALADLSADCDKTQTTIEGAAPGWRIDDSQAGYRVLSAPLASGVGRKTYKVISFGAQFGAFVVESWDAVAHVATNINNTGGMLYPTVAASGGVINVIASPAVVAVVAAADEAMFLLGELVDLTPSCAGYPSWFVTGRRTGPEAYAYFPRVKKHDAGGDTLSPSLYMRRQAPISGGAMSTSGERYYALHDIFVDAANTQGAAYMGRVRGVKSAMLTAMPLDEYTVGADCFVVVRPYIYLSQTECWGVLRG